MSSLTREEILNMPAGYKMDKLVTKKVFGLIRYPTKDDIGNTYGYCLDGNRIAYWDGANLHEFRPSTKISDAWLIAEELKLSLTPNLCYPEVAARWCCDIDLKGKNDLWLVGAETAPLAICRAALLVTKGFNG